MSVVGGALPDGVAFKSVADNASVFAATKKVKVTFRANGGSINSSTKSVRKVKKNKRIGTLPDVYRSGYTLVGWYTKKSGGTKVKASTKAKKNMTVYAQWADSYPTITFNPNGGRLEDSYEATKDVGYKETYGDLPTPKYAGYDFIGWYTARTGGKLITPTSTVNVKRDTTFYAHWRQKQDVKIVDMDHFSCTGDFSWYTYPAIFDNTETLRSGWVAYGSYFDDIGALTFLLNGQYKTMTGIVALASDSKDTSGKYLLKIYLDGTLKYTTSTYLTTGVLPIPTNLNVAGVQQIKFELIRASGGDAKIIVDETFKR